MDQQLAVGSAWQKFLKTCLHQRVSSIKFIELLQEYEAIEPRPLASAPESLARALLDCALIGQHVDPRIPGYLELLLDAKKINVISLLLAAAQLLQPDDRKDSYLALLDVGYTANLSLLQTVILQLLTRKVANGIIERDIELLAFLDELRPWMTKHPSSVTLGFLIATTFDCTLAQDVMPRVKAKSVVLPDLTTSAHR
ncbi:MAG: hypothetical protein Q9166_002132 [cf. Caloplaca sp. 2 TL-2023]